MGNNMQRGCGHVQVLQGAVEVVMEALRQIAAFEEAVQAQEMATARGDRSGDAAAAMTARQACARLQKLITQACTRVLTTCCIVCKLQILSTVDATL